MSLKLIAVGAKSHWQLVCLTQEHGRNKARKDLNKRIGGGKIRGRCPFCLIGHWQQECVYLNLRIRMDRGILGNFSHCSLPSWPGKTCECPIVNSKYLLMFCCCFEIGSCYVAWLAWNSVWRPVGLKLTSNQPSCLCLLPGFTGVHPICLAL